MGTLADSLFNVLMGWVRALVNSFWNLFDAEHTTMLEFLGKNWLLIAGLLIAAGLFIDWLVWMMRWKPYHRAVRRVRRLFHLEEDEAEAPEKKAPAIRAHAALRREQPVWTPEPLEEEEEAPLFVEQPSEEDEEAALHEAQSVPDEELGAYPGMLYGTQAAPRANLGETQCYAAVHREGPGAAEVERRRAEIDAWQQQMQEEARQKAEAERAAREAEQQRLAQEAYEAEQQRLAQQNYERELAEYREKQAQYERDMAVYRQQMAEYQEQTRRMEPVAGNWPDDGVRAYCRDAVDVPGMIAEPAVHQGGETIQMQAVQPEAEQDSGRNKKSGRLAGRMARMMESEDPDVISPMTTLPPRVDPRDAYRPAQKPPKQGRTK